MRIVNVSRSLLSQSFNSLLSKFRTPVVSTISRAYQLPFKLPVECSSLMLSWLK